MIRVNCSYIVLSIGRIPPSLDPFTMDCKIKCMYNKNDWMVIFIGISFFFWPNCANIQFAWIEVPKFDKNEIGGKNRQSLWHHTLTQFSLQHTNPPLNQEKGELILSVFFSLFCAYPISDYDPIIEYIVCMLLKCCCFIFNIIHIQ